MARTKMNRKKLVKKQQVQGNLQKKGSSVFGKKDSGHHDGIPSEISSTVTQKPVIQLEQTVRPPAALPEITPSSQRSRALRVKRLTDVFTKLPKQHTTTVKKKLAQQANITQSPVAKESRAVSHSDPSNNDKSADVAEAELEQNVEMEQGEAAKSVSNDVLQPTSYPRKHQQGNVKFYFYPVEGSKTVSKFDQPKSKAHKRKVTKVRTPATDELSEVLFWKSPSKKRTPRDLTDLEISFTVFKHTVKELSECVSDRSFLKVIEKYEKHFERNIVEELQSIEDAKKMMQEINKLQKENKKLSLSLGSLIDRKIKLQSEKAKRERETRAQLQK